MLTVEKLLKTIAYEEKQTNEREDIQKQKEITLKKEASRLEQLNIKKKSDLKKKKLKQQKEREQKAAAAAAAAPVVVVRLNSICFMIELYFTYNFLLKL